MGASAAPKECGAVDRPVWADGSSDHVECQKPRGHDGPHVGYIDGKEWRCVWSVETPYIDLKPLQRLEYALNDAGLGRGVTRHSIQRFYGVNAASAMILMVLREACFGVLAAKARE